MKEDKSIESAVFSTLYRDLLQGLRLQRRGSMMIKKQLEEQKQEGMDGRKAGRREYEGMLRAVVADEVVHPLERSLMDQNAQRLEILREEHEAMLVNMGWTVGEWERGMKDKVRVPRKNDNQIQGGKPS